MPNAKNNGWWLTNAPAGWLHQNSENQNQSTVWWMMKGSKTKLMHVFEEIETETSEVLWRKNEQKRRKCYFSCSLYWSFVRYRARGKSRSKWHAHCWVARCRLRRRLSTCKSQNALMSHVHGVWVGDCSRFLNGRQCRERSLVMVANGRMELPRSWRPCGMYSSCKLCRSGEGLHQHTVIYGRSRSGAFAVVRGWRRGDKNALERSQV